MVQKVKLLILFFIFVFLCFLGFTNQKDIEVNLLKTLLPKNAVHSEEIIQIANKTSSLIKVVFETQNEEDAQKLKDDFIQNIDNNYFEFENNNPSNLINLYLNNPLNFLSDKDKKLLYDKKYDEIYENAVNFLYNPLQIQLAPFYLDPYFLLDDYFLSFNKKFDDINYFNDKCYSYTTLKIKNKEGLSVDIDNEMAKLVKLQKELSSKDSKIYLSGTPIHSYYTKIKSSFDINIICILSTLMIIFLTYFYFKSIKPVVLVGISIIFGILSGFIAVKYWFNGFQIITLVFSTAIIGLGIDYSYHYFFADKTDKNFIKNLTLSFLTTVIPFSLIYLTNIELLKQISVFTVFGLFSIYFIVLFLYPCFNNLKAQKSIQIKVRPYKICFILLLIIAVFGIFRLNFNDALNTFYSPDKKLIKAEKIYEDVSKDNFQSAKIITVKGKNFDELIEEEEKITKVLSENGVHYLSLSKIFPSEKKQKENFELIKKLYENNLDKFSNILSNNQIKFLKDKKFEPVSFNLNNFSYADNFLLDDNKSVIYVFDPPLLKSLNIIDFKSDVENYIKIFRKTLLVVYPLSVIALILFISLIYGPRKGLKISAPPVLGSLFALLITSFIKGELNLFSIISACLVLGFTIDYSIFRANKNKKTEDAVFTSFLTTSFSFLLLSFSNFKLLSSMACVLFFGILTSYIFGFILFSDKNNEKAEWFEVKEQSAGRKRLILTWQLYKIFGKKILYVIGFLVSFFTFIFAPEIRDYSKKYFKVIKKETGLSPSLVNQFKLILSYSYSLVDKILVYCGDFDTNDIVFEDENKKNEFFKCINERKGVFLICNHIGNIEIMQSLFLKNKPDFNINIFMSRKQSTVFNDFLKTIQIDFPFKLYPVEDIGLNTGIELKENLDKGEIVFIAGDRLSQNNDGKKIEASMFDKKVYFPKGTYKLCKLMNAPTFLISAVKIEDKYKIYLQKENDLSENNLIKDNVQFMKKLIKINPYQFFHFYDFFN